MYRRVTPSAPQTQHTSSVDLCTVSGNVAAPLSLAAISTATPSREDQPRPNTSQQHTSQTEKKHAGGWPKHAACVQKSDAQSAKLRCVAAGQGNACPRRTRLLAPSPTSAHSLAVSPHHTQSRHLRGLEAALTPTAHRAYKAHHRRVMRAGEVPRPVHPAAVE